MVIAAGGFDTSGTVRLFRCPTPEVPLEFESCEESRSRGMSSVQYSSPALSSVP